MAKLGLCLSGGGSKGAYEIGVYRALRKLKKNPTIITGTSVGALNGMLIVQGDIYKATKLWSKISFDMIFNENSFENNNQNIAEIFQIYAKSFIKEGGMNITGLKEIFNEIFNAKKFFSSPIDFGIVTYNLTKNKPLEITKKQMYKKDPTGKLAQDYILASASCYPAFKPYKIKNDEYIDGGYYDNMPINLAIDMGADEIIAVDLQSVGFTRKIKDENIPITTIKPHNKLQPFLVFDAEKAREALRFGYNDTMKLYGKLDGKTFTFKKRNLIRNYNKYNEKFDETLYQILNNIDNKIINKILNTKIIKEYLNNKITYKNFNKIIEKAGEIFELAEDNIYNIKTFNKGLLNELTKTETKNIKEIIKEKTPKRKYIVKIFYNAITKKEINNIIKYIPLFIDEFLASLYIYSIKGKKIY